MPQLKYWDGTRYVPLLGGISQADADARYLKQGAAAGGDLAGTYPNPTLAVDRVRKAGDSMSGNLTFPAASNAGVKWGNFILYDWDGSTFAFYNSSSGQMVPAMVGAPTVAQHAATKAYVDTANALNFSMAGGWTYDGASTWMSSKSGGLVAVECFMRRTATLAVTANSGYAVGTIAAGHRPYQQVTAAAVYRYANATSAGARCTVDTAGTITFVPMVTGTMNANDFLAFNMTYYQGN